jgi:hypothetical protein
MEYPRVKLEANHTEHTISLIDISMIELGRWPSGEWQASGHHIVWHSTGRHDTIEAALRQLIDNIQLWASENGTRV